jgi:8-oxo-dGTP pyrophosphatase MutT (NUDIX family)
MLHEKSCGAVVFIRNGEINYLLLKYTNYWGFPKGLVEANETEKETARREIEEETGITDIRFLNGFREEYSYFYKYEGKTIHKTVVYFLAETNQKKVKLSYEHQSFKWLPFEEALKLLTYQKTKKLLEKAHKFLIKEVGLEKFTGKKL